MPIDHTTTIDNPPSTPDRTVLNLFAVEDRAVEPPPTTPTRDLYACHCSKALGSLGDYKSIARRANALLFFLSLSLRPRHPDDQPPRQTETHENSDSRDPLGVIMEVHEASGHGAEGAYDRETTSTPLADLRPSPTPSLQTIPQPRLPR